MKGEARSASLSHLRLRHADVGRAIFRARSVAVCKIAMRCLRCAP